MLATASHLDPATAGVTLAETLAERRAHGGGPVFGFEFFPPRDEAGSQLLQRSVAALEPLHPDFVSVTYGANGSNRARTLAATREMAATPFRTIGHLTCAAQSRDEVSATVDAYAEAGITHILAIRGDMPGGPTVPWHSHPEGLDNATELVRLVKSRGDFCVGVAAFPEAHPSTGDAALDARILADKVDAGAEFAITQLFFRADDYFSLVERVRDLGYDVPIIAGIMPVTNVNQVTKFAELSGAAMPASVADRLHAVADDPAAVRRVGAEIATELAVELLQGGAPGLQFFTQNRSLATREILARLLESRHW